MHPTLTISLTAITDNYRTLCAKASRSEVGCVVKADGYGLGAVRVAEALVRAGCRTLFVATLAEGIELRREIDDGPRIFVFHGIRPGEEKDMHYHGLLPVLNSLAEMDRWGKWGTAPSPCAIQIDTGMHRMGLTSPELERLEDHPEWLNPLDVKMVMSHLACADAPDHPLNKTQLSRFNTVRRWFESLSAPAESPIQFSLANSQAIYAGDCYHFDLVRPGMALYGLNPASKSINPDRNPMENAVSLTAPVIALREIDEGDTVGYGATFRAAGPTRVATVPVGYGDGYLRALGNHGHATVNGAQVPVIGRVSMDLVTLDVTKVPDIGLGDIVELMGVHDTPDMLAHEAGTIGYQLLTRLGKRFERVYVG